MPREVDGNLQECDNFEKTLRPQSLNEYIGQSELKENLNVAKRGGGVAKGARDLYEKETKKSALSKLNSLNYKYIDEKILEYKGENKNE